MRGASPQAQTRGNAPSPGRVRVFRLAVWPSPRARGEERRAGPPDKREGLSFGLTFPSSNRGDQVSIGHEVGHQEEPTSAVASMLQPQTQPGVDDIDGINAVALKWMRRSGLDPKSLQTLFSLGIDEIDLVAKSVPGTSKRERMRSVLLLKGIAAYLGTGAPRITYEQLKEACLHYDAYDAANFAKNLKSFSSDTTGTKEAGFTLTARGLTSATDLLKELLGSRQA
jgi:hypothetical protein